MRSYIRLIETAQSLNEGVFFNPDAENPMTEDQVIEFADRLTAATKRKAEEIITQHPRGTLGNMNAGVALYQDWEHMASILRNQARRLGMKNFNIDFPAVD